MEPIGMVHEMAGFSQRKEDSRKNEEGNRNDAESHKNRVSQNPKLDAEKHQSDELV